MADEPESSGQGEEKPAEGVFTKFIKTVTFQNGYKNDGTDAQLRKLNAAAVNSPSAVQGLAGATHQTFIMGDSAIKMTSNHSQWIDGNDMLAVKGTQTNTIQGKTELLCLSDYMRGVKGNENLRVEGNQTIIVLGASEANYVGAHEVNAPEETEWKSFERGFSFTKLDTAGFILDVHGANIELFGANVEAGVETADGAAFHQEIKLSHEEASPLLVRTGIEADVLLRVDALLDVGLGTPFR